MAKRDAPTLARSDAPAAQLWSRFRRHKLAMTGLVVMAVIVTLTLLAPAIARFDPNAVNLLARDQSPTFTHWLGTDRTGRDTFARLLYAGRVSLLVGLAAVSISVAVGTVAGALAGYFGGLVDAIIMRVVDVIMTFPAIIVLLTTAALFGPGIDRIIIIVGLLNAPIPCRLVRSRLMALRTQDFITAAEALGARSSRVILRHALPNSVDVLIVYATLGFANAILLEAGLSFLGLGIQPPTPSWGNMLNAARSISVLEGYPWQWLPAGAIIVLTVLAINFLGDGLRDAFDPRSKL